MDKFAKADPVAAAIFEDLVADIACEKRKMFGFPVAFINGNMFSGIYADRLFFRLSEDDRRKWKEECDAFRDFEPVKGRKMKEYLEIAGSEEHRALMKKCIEESERFTRRLPVKEEKKK